MTKLHMCDIVNYIFLSDINECVEGHNCTEIQTCINIDGSYYCINPILFEPGKTENF